MELYGPGTSRVFFDAWFVAINSDNKLPRVHDKKLSIVALCSLMEIDPSAIPDVLKEGWPSVVAGALKLFKDLPKAMEGWFSDPAYSKGVTDKLICTARMALADAFEEDSEDEDLIDDTKLLNMNDEEGVCSHFFESSTSTHGNQQRTSGTRIRLTLRCWQKRYVSPWQVDFEQT